jgi:hypothetical protein
MGECEIGLVAVLARAGDRAWREQPFFHHQALDLVVQAPEVQHTVEALQHAERLSRGAQLGVVQQVGRDAVAHVRHQPHAVAARAEVQAVGRAPVVGVGQPRQRTGVRALLGVEADRRSQHRARLAQDGHAVVEARQLERAHREVAGHIGQRGVVQAPPLGQFGGHLQAPHALLGRQWLAQHAVQRGTPRLRDMNQQRAAHKEPEAMLRK